MTLGANDFTILISLAMLSACTTNDVPNSAAGSKPMDTSLIGLSQGSTVTFTRSPDGGALSLLYDNASLEWVPNDEVKPEQQKTLTHSFTLEAAGSPVKLRAWVRGFRMGAEPGGSTLRFVWPGGNTDLSAQLADDDFLACFDMSLADQSSRVAWTTMLKQRPGETSKLTIDSIDLARRDESTPPLNDGQCPDAPPATANP